MVVPQQPAQAIAPTDLPLVRERVARERNHVPDALMVALLVVVLDVLAEADARAHDIIPRSLGVDRLSRCESRDRGLRPVTLPTCRTRGSPCGASRDCRRARRLRHQPGEQPAAGDSEDPRVASQPSRAGPPEIANLATAPMGTPAHQIADRPGFPACPLETSPSNPVGDAISSEKSRRFRVPHLSLPSGCRWHRRARG